LPVLHALDISGDNPALLVSSEILKKIRFVQISSIAIADYLAKTHLADCSQPDYANGIPATLTKESDRSTLVRKVEPPGEAAGWAVDPHAIRSYNPDPSLGGNLKNFFLERQTLAPDLTETGSKKLGKAYALAGTLLRKLRSESGRDTDNGKVNTVRHLLNAAIDCQPLKFAHGAADGVNSPLEPELQKRIYPVAAAKFARIIRDANHSYRPGMEKVV
jgi:hypothetical protein